MPILFLRLVYVKNMINCNIILLHNRKTDFQNHIVMQRIF